MSASCASCLFRSNELVVVTVRGTDRLRRDTKMAPVCRRYPPIANPNDGGLASKFPPVKDEDWCGEYREAEDQAVAA